MARDINFTPVLDSGNFWQENEQKTKLVSFIPKLVGYNLKYVDKARIGQDLLNMDEYGFEKFFHDCIELREVGLSNENLLVNFMMTHNNSKPSINIIDCSLKYYYRGTPNEQKGLLDQSVMTVTRALYYHDIEKKLKKEIFGNIHNVIKKFSNNEWALERINKDITSSS